MAKSGKHLGTQSKIHFIPKDLASVAEMNIVANIVKTLFNLSVLKK